MPLVRPIPGTDNAFEKIPTSGDAVRFVTAQQGKRHLVQLTDSAPNAAARNIDITGDPIFTLPFDYLFGVRQLEVFELDSTTFVADRLVEKTVYDEANAGVLTTVAVPPAAAPYFEEVSKDQVRIINPTNTTDAAGSIYLFAVPHTSLPAENENRVVVAPQPDSQGLRLKGLGDGIVFKDSNGVEYILTITTGGRVAVNPVL